VITADLQLVIQCLFYIQEARDNQKISKTFIDKWNWLWGEMDWMEELHRLIYENED